MSTPTEVLLVDEKYGLGQSLYRAALAVTLFGLLGGFSLMLLAPLLTETLNWPRLAPGYWHCVGLIVLARLTVRAVIAGGVRPTRAVRS